MKSVLLVAVATVSLAGCAGPSFTETQKAPEPRKRIDVQRFYTGTWHEIARRPMTITDGCVAGATEYWPIGTGGIQVLDSCRMRSPGGELKSVGGPGTILDPGINAKLRVDYKLYGFVCSANTGCWTGRTTTAGSYRPTRLCAICISSRAIRGLVRRSATSWSRGRLRWDMTLVSSNFPSNRGTS